MHPLYRSTRPIGRARCAESPNGRVLPDGRLSVRDAFVRTSGRPGCGSDRTQRRGRFSHSQASHAARRKRQRKTSERDDACTTVRIRRTRRGRGRAGDHPYGPVRDRSFWITGCRTDGGRGRLGGVARCGSPDVAAPPDVAALLADLAGIGPFFAVGTGALPGEGWVPVGALGDPRGPLAGRIEAVGAALRCLRAGGRVDRVPGHRGAGRRAAVRGGGGTWVLPAAGVARALHWRPGGGGPWLWWPAGGPVVACPDPAVLGALVTDAARPGRRRRPGAGRGRRAGAVGQRRRRPWRARGNWSRRPVRTPPRAPPPSPGTCSPPHRSRPRRRCATPHRPTSAGPSSAARAASTTGSRAAGCAATACCAGRSAEPAPPEVAHRLSPRLD